MRKRFLIICVTILLLVGTIILSSCNNADNKNENTDNVTESGAEGNQESKDDTTGTTQSNDNVINPTASEGLEFCYSDDETSYLVCGIGDCKDKDIVIPAEHNGLSVSGINAYAFSWNDDIVSVTMPDTITEIGASAFSGCKNLKKVVMSDKITVIPKGAFNYCEKLNSINIPDGVTTIDSSAFSECCSLMKIVLPSSLTQIGENAFLECEQLIEIYNLSKLNIAIGASDLGGVGLYAKKIHSSLSDTSIINQVGDYIFASYEGIHYLYAYTGNDDMLVLPENYNGSNYQIARKAFYYNKTLTQITIPKSVTLIGLDAFTGCYSLVEVYNLSDLSLWAGATVPDQDGDGRVAFYARAIHTTLDEPSIIEKHNGFVFMELEDIVYLVRALGDSTEIILPDSYHGKSYEIYEHAFYRNKTIEKITFSNGVTAIGDYAFYSCDNLSDIVLTDSLVTIGEHAFADCYSLKTMSIPNSVKNVGWEAFSSMSKDIFNEYDNAYYLGNSTNPYLILVKAKSTDITSCTIHEGTKFIMSNSFDECSNLNNLTIPRNVIVIGRHAFDDCSNLTNVIFANPEGWYVDNREQTQLASPILAVGEIAADYLTDIYRFEDLKRVEQ